MTYIPGTAGGDASTNTSTSVDSEVAVFSGAGGKTLKRATQTGVLRATSGVIAATSIPSDAKQFLNGAATPAFAQVQDSDLSTSDVTTNNVSTSKHGFTPKLPNDATKYLDGTGAYTAPPGVSGGAGNAASFTRMDEAPSSPNSKDEEFNSTSLSAYTWAASSGTVTNQALGEWIDTQPSEPSWNANTDLKGSLVMMPKVGQDMKAYRTYAPTAATKAIVMARVRLVNGSGTDDFIGIVICKDTPPSSGANPANGVVLRLRINSTTYEVQRYTVNASGAPSNIQSASLGTSYTNYVYLGFIVRASNSIETFYSTDGIHRIAVGSAITSLNVNANINFFYIDVTDGHSGSVACVGVVDWLRFLEGDLNFWHMGAGY